jgi:hypothetical protein
MEPIIIYSGDYGTRAATLLRAEELRRIGRQVHIIWKIGH